VQRLTATLFSRRPAASLWGPANHRRARLDPIAQRAGARPTILGGNRWKGPIVCRCTSLTRAKLCVANRTGGWPQVLSPAKHAVEALTQRRLGSFLHRQNTPNLAILLQRRATAPTGHGISEAASSSLDVARFGALHEPRRRHSPTPTAPPPMAASACLSSRPPAISRAICYKARNTPPPPPGRTLEHHSAEPVPPRRREGVCAGLSTSAHSPLGAPQSSSAYHACNRNITSSLDLTCTPSMTHAVFVREARHASLDLVLGHPFAEHRLTHADMSLYAGALVKQAANPTDPVPKKRSPCSHTLKVARRQGSAMQGTDVCRQIAQLLPTNLPAPASSYPRRSSCFPGTARIAWILRRT
jgi:hypothetical protein